MQTVDYAKFGLNAGDAVLDLGCGEGRHVISAYTEDDVTAVGVDLCFADLRTTQQRFESFAEPGNKRKSFSLLQSNALHLPFADDSFDKVVCSEVLEHIPDWRGALAEIERVLKPGGSFCASVPRYWPERICWLLSDEYHAMEGGHLRIFRAGELRGAIEQLGFGYRGHHWAHALHAPFWWLKCALWRHQERSVLIRWYHRLLVWDLLERPALTGGLERLLNPVLGKSVVMYFRKNNEVVV